MIALSLKPAGLVKLKPVKSLLKENSNTVLAATVSPAQD
jgi:hypothetical protein